MSYRIAGIDVHKKMLAVVVTDVEIDSEYPLQKSALPRQPFPPTNVSPHGSVPAPATTRAQA